MMIRFIKAMIQWLGISMLILVIYDFIEMFQYGNVHLGYANTLLMGVMAAFIHDKLFGGGSHDD